VTGGELELEQELKALAAATARTRKSVQQVAGLASACDLRGLRQWLGEAQARLEEAKGTLATVAGRLGALAEQSLSRRAELYWERFLA
jgi:hypothetical protein